MFTRRITRRNLVLVATLVAASGFAAAVQSDKVDVQYRTKAELIHELAKYVGPEPLVAGPDNTFVIGILGKDPFDGVNEARQPVNHLRVMVDARKTFNGLKLVIRQFDSAKDYQPCHVLFVSAKAAEKSVEWKPEERLKAAVEKTKGSPVVLVGDTKGFAQQGAVINYFLTPVGGGEMSVNFELNPDAAARAGIRIDPRILRLATIVRDNAERAGTEAR